MGEDGIFAKHSYPCRKSPMSYSKLLLFHGGDTGLIPVRDAKIHEDRFRKHHNDYPLFGRKNMNARPLMASPVLENYLTAAAPSRYILLTLRPSKEIPRNIAAHSLACAPRTLRRLRPSLAALQPRLP